MGLGVCFGLWFGGGGGGFVLQVFLPRSVGDFLQNLSPFWYEVQKFIYCI